MDAPPTTNSANVTNLFREHSQTASPVFLDVRV
jgi:hypothetical protein